MTYRIRTWSGGYPLPNMDITTSSTRVMVEEVTAKAARYGTWDDVSVLIPGERAFKGDELRRYIERIAA